MERFAFKIDKSVKTRLQKLCRLCGMDNPNKMNILGTVAWMGGDDDIEPDLSTKIYECVGIQVFKNDRMPKQICLLCCDKINDFYEFHEMCSATNKQTRQLLGLPDMDRTNRKAIAKIEEPDNVESIFGLVGDEIKSEPNLLMPKAKKTKKTLKSSLSNVTIRSDNELLIPDSIEIAHKRGKKRNGNKSTTTPLLAPKELNKRERNREREQKQLERKRKAEERSTALNKKMKKEPGISCKICYERFESTKLHTTHLLEHLPTISEHGCSSCSMLFATKDENQEHFEWHKTSNIPYKCLICCESFIQHKFLKRHCISCVDPIFRDITTVENILCNLCQTEFETKNLYDWHKCFIRDNEACPKCQRVFTKQKFLFRHLFQCNGAKQESTQPKVGRPRKRTADVSFKNAGIKAEPEVLIEPVYDENHDEEIDIDSNHFADADSDSDHNFDSINNDNNIDVPDTQQKSKKYLSLKKCMVKLEPIDLAGFPNTLINNFDLMQTVRENVTAPPAPTSVEPTPSTSKSASLPHRTPLILRIKKEPLHSGYGDLVFDHVLARNIKKERGEIEQRSTNQKQKEIPNFQTIARNIKKERGEIESRQTAQKQKETPDFQTIARNIKKERGEIELQSTIQNDPIDFHTIARNIKKERGEIESQSTIQRLNDETDLNLLLTQKTATEIPKKLYKKPALLALKIQQERMAREEAKAQNKNIDDYNDSTIDGTIGSKSQSSLVAMPSTSSSLNQETALPIITQIHSAVGCHLPVNIQVPVISNVIAGKNIALLAPECAPSLSNKVSQARETIPFSPIRIKSEFKTALSPVKNNNESENHSPGRNLDVNFGDTSTELLQSSIVSEKELAPENMEEETNSIKNIHSIVTSETTPQENDMFDNYMVMDKLSSLGEAIISGNMAAKEIENESNQKQNNQGNIDDVTEKHPDKIIYEQNRSDNECSIECDQSTNQKIVNMEKTDIINDETSYVSENKAVFKIISDSTTNKNKANEEIIREFIKIADNVEENDKDIDTNENNTMENNDCIALQIESNGNSKNIKTIDDCEKEGVSIQNDKNSLVSYTNSDSNINTHYQSITEIDSNNGNLSEKNDIKIIQNNNKISVISELEFHEPLEKTDTNNLTEPFATNNQILQIDNLSLDDLTNDAENDIYMPLLNDLNEFIQNEEKNNLANNVSEFCSPTNLVDDVIQVPKSSNESTANSEHIINSSIGDENDVLKDCIAFMTDDADIENEMNKSEIKNISDECTNLKPSMELDEVSDDSLDFTDCHL